VKKKNTLIIAEAGVNHNGSLKKALKLIDYAKIAGADIVKFQTFNPDNLLIPSAKKAPYQKNKNKNETQYQMLEKLSLNLNFYKILSAYSKKKKIEFLSTAFDIKNLKMLIKLGIKRIKIPSGEITNILLLEFAAKQKLPIILSTGMSNLNEIKKAIKILTKFGKKKTQITILHCTSVYPAPFNELNLKAIKTMKKQLGVSVGYSDHTLGTEASIAAVALGAKIIEKHFTISKKMNGPDHKASLDPKELHLMISSIRNLEKSFGNGIKKVTKSEILNRRIFRRSLVALTNINTGDLLTFKNIGMKRPGTGVSPINIHKYLGKKSSKNIKKNKLIT